VESVLLLLVLFMVKSRFVSNLYPLGRPSAFLAGICVLPKPHADQLPTLLFLFISNTIDLFSNSQVLDKTIDISYLIMSKSISKGTRLDDSTAITPCLLPSWGPTENFILMFKIFCRGAKIFRWKELRFFPL